MSSIVVFNSGRGYEESYLHISTFVCLVFVVNPARKPVR